MPIPVICSCSAKMKVGDHLKGKHIKCPKCGTVLAVGGPNGSAPAAAAPKAPPKPALPSADEVLGQSSLSQERERLQGELGRDEQLLWAGKPSARVAFLRGWLIAGGLYFSAVILLVMLLVMNGTGAFHGLGSFVIIILGVVILGLCAGGTACPFVTRWYKRRTAYAATTKRALALVPNWFGKIQHVSYDPSDMVKLYRREMSKSEGGVGDLVFGSIVKEKTTKDGIQRTTYVYGFWLVPEAARVEKLLREHLIDPILDRLYEEKE